MPAPTSRHLPTRPAAPARAVAAWRVARRVAVGVALVFGTRSAAAQREEPASAVAAAHLRPGEASAAGQRREVPWGLGERLTYDVKFGPVRVGRGAMEIAALERVRGREAYRARFTVRGGTFFYKVDDRLESWMDTRTLESLRFHKDQDEGGRERSARFEIFPERATFQQDDGPEQRSVADPLDEASFLYFVRTLPLKTGDVYALQNYFRPDRNPVTIRVLRRERVRVPAGTFDAVVVQPTFKTKGIFGEGGRAEVWLTDDGRRIMVQMKSSLSFGTLSLHLREQVAGERLASN
jgi:hypothetical protein